MSFKFEKLEVWQMAINYADLVYEMADKLPDHEKFNLKSQITRAATSVALNIAKATYP
jgi:four helix bundle protein